MGRVWKDSERVEPQHLILFCTEYSGQSSQDCKPDKNPASEVHASEISAGKKDYISFWTTDDMSHDLPNCLFVLFSCPETLPET